MVVHKEALVRSLMADGHGDDYFVPLVDQRVFGAGIKRKRVAFVPATADKNTLPRTDAKKSSAGDTYLSIVLRKNTEISSHVGSAASAPLSANELNAAECPICGQPLSNVRGNDDNHETSIAHQVCLEHSHPPSHLDRSRTGLRYLQDYGWDPDARKGLGAQQEGIRIPIKAKQKHDTSGIGIALKNEDDEPKRKRKNLRTPAQEETVKLNAKEVRKVEIEKKKRAEKLRRSIYGDDLSAYLASNG
ncbi:hypothetical protein H2198_008736 [Neophaeococcomyces mojaviensis]|uniref:Uncharacterized protein n=1 Tax=Neophaeococcomyces mojaviensis TaxID=3383035 RepID=A0ACC2ZWC6_9EURO|nr:hypothetical protein H2198_008736 [Knufia sp. JES_112]